MITFKRRTEGIDSSNCWLPTEGGWTVCPGSNRWALPLLDGVLNPHGVRLLELSDIDSHRGMPPAEEADRPPGQGSPSPALQLPVSGQPIKMPRVLLVDDSPTMRRVLRGLLEDAGIHVVAEAADGAEGVELAAALRPDVVLMDWRMPRLDGVQATARIRQQLPEVQVVMFTSLEGAGIGTAARDAGASAFVTKGASPAQLCAAVLAAAPSA